MSGGGINQFLHVFHPSIHRFAISSQSRFNEQRFFIDFTFSLLERFIGEIFQFFINFFTILFLWQEKVLRLQLLYQHRPCR